MTDFTAGSRRTGSPTRDLTSAEWRWLARRSARARRAVAAAAAFAWCLGSYLAHRARAAASSADARAFAVCAAVAAVLGAVCAVAALRPTFERPGGRARQVGRLRGVLRVGGKPARTSIGGVPVRIPDEWLGQLPLGDPVEVEVTPPIGLDGPWFERNQLRRVVSAYDGRLRIGDLGSGPPAQAAGPAPPVDEAALARARAAGTRPLTAQERAAARRRVARSYGPFFVIVLPAAIVVNVCGWVLATFWRTLPLFAAVMGAAGVFGGVIVVAVTRSVFRRSWLGRAGDFVRAGRLGGWVATADAPPRTYVAGVRVVLPAFNELPTGQHVELEVTPPLADDSDPKRGRIVVAILDGAPSLFDPDAPRTPDKPRARRR